MSTWTSIKNYLKKFLKLSERQTYLSRRVDNLEHLNAQGSNLPFIVAGIKEKGFSVKVCGLYGYISFNHMPWDYPNYDAWKAIFPHITGKIFFSKLYKLTRDPLSIVLNGDTPQFRSPALTEGQRYQGIIINRVHYGLFIDIGYAFKWNCGSIVGLLHRSNFDTDEQFDSYKTGEIVDVLFWGYHEKDKPIFGKKAELKEWITGEVCKLVGSVMPVRVIRQENSTTFLVGNKFKGTMPTSKEIYPRKRGEIREAVRNFNHGDTILCEILHANQSQRTLQLKLIPAEIAKITSTNTVTKENTRNTIENIMTPEMAEKLYLFGETVNVEVKKERDYFGREQAKYIVENKYKGILEISNLNYKITNKEKKLIVKNLEDGEVLLCKVERVEKSQITVKWQLSDQELYKFLR